LQCKNEDRLDLNNNIVVVTLKTRR